MRLHRPDIRLRVWIKWLTHAHTCFSTGGDAGAMKSISPPPLSQQLFNLFFTLLLSLFFSLYPFFVGPLIVRIHSFYLTDSAVQRPYGGVFLKSEAVRSKSRMKAGIQYITYWPLSQFETNAAQLNDRKCPIKMLSVAIVCHLHRRSKNSSLTKVSK